MNPLTRTIPGRPSAAGAPPARRRFLAHPLGWMPVGVAGIVAVDAACTAVGPALGTGGTVVGALVGAVLAVVVYRLVMHRLAGRATPELTLGLRQAGRESLAGGALGAGLLVVAVGLVALLGGYTLAWHPVDPLPTVAVVVAVNLGAAVVEELVFRGLVFHAVERLARGGRLGAVLALSVTAVLFGAAHLLNPGATVWTALAIAVESGLLTGAAFVWKRSLWLAIGLHAAWNILEGLLGMAVSGHRDPGLFITTVHGPVLLNGGGFGLEGSLVSVLLGLALAVSLLVAWVRRTTPRPAAEPLAR